MKKESTDVRCQHARTVSLVHKALGCFSVHLVVMISFCVASAVGQDLSTAEVNQPSPESPPTASNDWPRFLGVNYDGSVTEGDESVLWSSAPVFQWQLPVGDGYGIASVADGLVYQCDSIGGSRFKSGDERLRCLDLETGELVWEMSETIQYQDLYGYEAGPRSSPVVHRDKVITYGVTGLLTCRQKSDGRQIWQVDVNKKYGVVQNFFGVGASPLVVDDLVVVMVGGSPPEDQDLPPGQLDRVIPDGSALVAFDLRTGQQKWKVGDDLASYSSPRVMEIGGVTAVILFARNGLIAVDSKTGRQLWRFDHRASILESVNGMMPVVRGDQVFISECYQVGSVLLEVDQDSPKVIWRDDRRSREKAMRSHWSTPVLVGDFLYGCSGRNAPDSDFRCVSFSTGKVQWVDPRRTRSSVTRWGDHLLVMEERGLLEVMKVNPQKMEVVASHDLSVADGDRPALQFPCWSAPVVVGDRLLLRGDQKVICLRWQSK